MISTHPRTRDATGPYPAAGGSRRPPSHTKFIKCSQKCHKFWNLVFGITTSNDEKCIQISANMPGIGLDILRIRRILRNKNIVKPPMAYSLPCTPVRPLQTSWYLSDSNSSCRAGLNQEFNGLSFRIIRAAPPSVHSIGLSALRNSNSSSLSKVFRRDSKAASIYTVWIYRTG